MTLYIFLISLLLLSLLSAVVSDDASFQKLPVPGKRSGPESFAFDSTGKAFYTGVSGGKILKYTPDKGFVDFAQITKTSTSSWCKGVFGTALAKKCGRPAGIAFNPKTGDLYVADAPLGLHVIHPAGGVATKIADSVDGKPFKFLDGLDVDPTTGVVYFTSFSSKFSPSEVFIAVGVKDASGKLFKYDPATKAVTVLMEDLSGAAGCAVSSDGSFVLVSEFIKSNIKRYWIKGPKAGSTDDIFSSSVSNPDNIRRIGSTGNFWVASVINKVVMPTDPSAVKIDSNGKVLQTIFLKNEFGNTLLSEANEVDGKLYIGTLTGPFAGMLRPSKNFRCREKGQALKLSPLIPPEKVSTPEFPAVKSLNIYRGRVTSILAISQKSQWCDGALGIAYMSKCGRPAGIAFNNKTGELYVADAPLGLHVIPSGGGYAKKIADSADGKPFLFLDGLDVDPTTGVVYFTSFSSKFSPGDVLKAVASKDASGKLFKYDPSKRVVTVLLEGLSGPAGCAVSSDGSFVLVSQFTKSNIKRYWIKGSKAGTSEDFTNAVSNPDNIKRIGSSGNFWVASVVNTATGPTNPSAVKINSDGRVLQTISVKDKFGDTLVSEVNEFEGRLYVGTLSGPFAGIIDL
ncbi:hypothetical protein IGI04_006293 [Brassica rapa subsp. trilocularis]|uniref:Strictosidine synthase conserved region domain-containing protein n=1 Tax=Brassica rapa subsp. trilocularis TaxID=1813537 RepID=A0ABQ7NGI8_BRACM|nr:hypothetical protein IGI04_006293 [Brassica rapa subsp. trilocularis]